MSPPAAGVAGRGSGSVTVAVPRQARRWQPGPGGASHGGLQRRRGGRAAAPAGAAAAAAALAASPSC